MKENLIQQKTYDFALKIINTSRQMNKNKEFVLSRQLLKSGTSIGANVEEAIGGHSKKDFLAKMIISYKEARETKYWLRLLEKSKLVNIDYRNYLKEIDSIINILTAIIKTSKQNQ